MLSNILSSSLILGTAQFIRIGICEKTFEEVCSLTYEIYFQNTNEPIESDHFLFKYMK